MEFLPNPNFSTLPKPAPGDIIHIKVQDMYTYLFKIIINNINDGKYLGTIDCIFDWDAETQIITGDINKYIGKEIELHPTYIHGVFKPERA